MSTRPASQPIQIRKYPNRRFYDVTHSRHATLQDLYHFVRSGENIQVFDSRSGADITPLVLMQIILEHDPPKMSLFGSGLLHQVIQANQQLLRAFMDNYFVRALDAFMGSQQQFEKFLRQTGLPVVPQMTAANPLNWARAWFGQNRPNEDAPVDVPPDGEAASPPPDLPPIETESELKATVDDLRQQLDEMRRELGARGAARNRKSKPDRRKP